MEARHCPLCESTDHERVIELEAAKFCRVNWTYSQEYAAILGIDERSVFPVVRCRRCAMVFSLLVPGPEFMTALYERVITKASCIAGSETLTGHARRLRYVAELLELAPVADPLRALDYGSGVAVTTRILHACGIEAYGFDPSTARTDYGREFDLNVVTDRKALSGVYEIVVLDNVLEHLPVPVETLQWLRSVTAPGTIAYVSVPSFEESFLKEQVQRHRRGLAIDMTLNPWEHLNYFSLVHLDTLMSRGGFRRLAASDRTSAPTVGLRATRSAVHRSKNAAASMARLLRYAIQGEVLATAEGAFYRRES